MLSYLTVFRSRIGAVNLVLTVTSFAYQPEASVVRRLTRSLSETIDLHVSDDASNRVFEYLLEKRLVGNSRSGSRYGSYSLERRDKRWHAARAGKPVESLAVYQTDLWMSDPLLPSTVGVPTAENVREILELAVQLGLVSTSNWAWTGSGQLVAGVRSLLTGVQDANPFRLYLEASVLLRQVIERDGFFMRELLRAILASESPITRDEFALRSMVEVARATVEQMREHRVAEREITEARAYWRLFEQTQAKRKKHSAGPGVLEHRLSPRLEWLTDLGALSKRELPRNGFRYRWTQDGRRLLALLDKWAGNRSWADEVALAYYGVSEYLSAIRAHVPSIDTRQALVQGYRLMDRGVGPTSIRDVCFAAGLLLDSGRSAADLQTELSGLSSREKAVSLSGGRYSRLPEMVHMAREFLRTEAE